MAWTNNDGLLIRFGADKAVTRTGGESTTDGNDRVITLDFDFNDFGAVGTETVLGEEVKIPDGAIIKSANLSVSTAFTSGGAATLDLGLIDVDRTTVYDADGLDAAVAVAALTEGATIVGDGAAVEAKVNNAGTAVLVTSTVGTAAFTAGAAQLVITYYIP